ncbi:MAG: hypothetical protein CL917_03935 [Deltaproteobacteria bacterium]|nr:hypothetical protein [Deltaproteobacteria bacterium]
MAGGAFEFTQTFFLSFSFWLAVWSFRGDAGGRFVLGLVLGAIFSRCGWALLHFRVWLQAPLSLWGETGGFTVLALPLGPWLMSLTFPSAAQSVLWRANAVRALLPALALARGGCWWMGCCGGEPFLAGYSHPVAAYEMIGWGILWVVLKRVPDVLASGVFFVGFGAIRWFLHPFRSVPSLGPPEVEITTLALGWIAWGVLSLLWGVRQTYLTKERVARARRSSGSYEDGSGEASRLR